MASFVNFDQGALNEGFNIFLDTSGDLNFKANGQNGEGSTRLAISDNSGQVTIGGSGAFGALQLKDPSDGNTIFIGASETDANASLGGGGLAGGVQLFDSAGRKTIDMLGSSGSVELFDSTNHRAIAMRASSAGLTLGSRGGSAGDVTLYNSSGTATILLRGETGTCDCSSHTERSDVRLKKDIAPLLNALDKVLALRGVRYQWKQEGAQRIANSEASQIGFIGQEMETVCPELVATDAEGYKSLNYSRMTPILVEAIKEQYQIICRQASELKEALSRIAKLENHLQTQ
jgi:Chaperone of endosialidase